MLDECHVGLFVRNANHCIPLQKAHLFALLNMAWSLADQATVGYLSAPVTSAQMPFSSGFLTSKALVQITTSGPVRLEIYIDAFMTDGHFACNLHKAPLNQKVESYISADLRVHTVGIEAAQGSLRLFGAGLIGAIPTQAKPADKFWATGAAVSAQQSGYLANGLLGFQKAAGIVHLC